MENSAGWRPQGSSPAPQEEDWDLPGIALFPLLSLALPRPQGASCSDNVFFICRKLAVLSRTKHVCQVWLYLSPPSASTDIDGPWKDVTALPGSNLVKWDSKIMAQLCWNVVTDVFDTALPRKVNEGGDVPKELWQTKATISEKGRTWEFSSCHPRRCFSYFLSGLPAISATLAISSGHQQILTQLLCTTSISWDRSRAYQEQLCSFAAWSGSITDSKGLWKLWSRASLHYYLTSVWCKPRWGNSLLKAPFRMLSAKEGREKESLSLLHILVNSLHV